MPDRGVAATKASLRDRVLASRAAAGDLGEVSRTLSGRLLRLPELAGARTVVGYAATAHEVSIDDALRRLLAEGVRVCLPWVQGRDLGVGAVEDLDALAPGYRGVREPVPGRREPVRPSAVDVFVVPGVAFDRSGNRLGYGGGHFDRLLSRASRAATVVGVCLDDQLVAAVPADAHDVAVDVVVTPTQTVRAAPRL